MDARLPSWVVLEPVKKRSREKRKLPQNEEGAADPADAFLKTCSSARSTDTNLPVAWVRVLDNTIHPIQYLLYTQRINGFHEKTALGVLSSSDLSGIPKDHVLRTVSYLVTLSPESIRRSERFVGDTALRSAVRNISCPADVIRMLIERDLTYHFPGRDGSPALYTFDQDGLLPIDHLFHQVYLEFSGDVVEKLRIVLSFMMFFDDPKIYGKVVSHSHFVRFLSMGSIGSTECANKLARICSTVQLLLQFPSVTFPHGRTQTTGCTALHVALRRHATNLPLLTILLDNDKCHSYLMTRTCNHNGDLPIHVACRVGVTIDVFKLILTQTVLADQARLTYSKQHGTPLVWSANCEGYSPIDLCWICHVEPQKDYIYPMTKMSPTAYSECRSSDEVKAFYGCLLQKNAEQMIDATVTIGISDRQSSFLSDHNHVADSDGFITRLMGIINASCGTTCWSLNETNILHKSTRLNNLGGPELPIVILKMILWMFPEQVRQRDNTGQLPLHHAAQRGNNFEGRRQHREWFTVLLRRYPCACSIADFSGRLPLHYALQDNTRARSYVEGFWDEIVLDMISCYPQSVDRCDPCTGLWPCMLAASQPSLALSTLYIILRMSPGFLSTTTGSN